MEANPTTVFLVSLFIAICALVLAALFCAGALEAEHEAIQSEGWHSPFTKPEKIGRYEIRPLSKPEMIQTVYWDGNKYRNQETWLECYWQDVEWREVTAEPETINQVRAREGYDPIPGGGYFLLDRSDIEQLRYELRMKRLQEVEKAA